MKFFIWLSVLFCLCTFLPRGLVAGEKAPPKVFELAQGALAAMGRDPVIVKAVQDKNSQGESLDQVKSRDEQWKNTPGVDDFMKALMDSECGRYLTSIINSAPYFAEIFVMDQNGANVAMADKTSDYWQGDEAKFIKSFNNGTGAVFVDDVEFDDSTQTYLVQVSVPVMDKDRAIGAITFGLDIGKVE